MRKFILSLVGKKNLIGAEVGVYRGSHAKRIFHNLNLKELHLIDNFANRRGLDNYLTCKRKFKGYKQLWHIMDSIDVAKCIKDDYFDFVYIDANHNYECVKEDIEAWWPKVKKGGFLAGHDIELNGVDKAVSEFIKNNPDYKCVKEENEWKIKKGF